MSHLRISLLVLLPLVVSCSELQTMGDRMGSGGMFSAPVIDGRQGVHSWLADLHGLRARPEASLPSVLEAREAAFRAQPSLDNRMRLVMLLLVDNDNMRDENRALLLLEGLESLPASPGEREFVMLLQQFMNGSKDDQEKLSVLWGQVTQQNQRIDELEQQLKALTSIEKNIQQREPLPAKQDAR